MSDSRHTNFVTQAALMGLCNSSGVVTTDLNALQMEELLRTASAAGCKVKFSAPVDATYDTWVLAPSHAGNNTLTIRASKPGNLVAGEGTNAIASIVCTQGNDSMTVANVAGVITLTLANSTGANNTLTLIKAAFDALSLASGSVFETFITGTASTQMGTATQAFTVTAPGAQGQVGTGCLKSTAAGVAASPAVAAGVMTIVTA